MKIYIGHSKEFNFKEELYQPIRESALDAEHEIILPHEKAGSLNTKEIIKTADIVVAEVSHPSTGLGIELGWADSFELTIVCIYQKDAKISDSLKAVCKNFIEYNDKKDLIEKITQALPYAVR